MQFSLSLSVGHGDPLHTAVVVAMRARVRMPAPHVALHVDHAAHWLTTQFTAQHGSMHDTVSLKSLGHGVPPFAAAVVTLRVRVFITPVPHVAPHADHAPQLLTAQCTGGAGHAGCAHACCSLATPAHCPPHAAIVATDRARVCTPAPHVTEQPDHADHGVHTHSVGQHPPFAVHIAVSLSAPHTPPHDSADTFVRVRVCTPAPHDTEQPDHAPHALSVQSTAQHDPPHACCCVSSLGHAAPPHAAFCTTMRDRVCTPPPHWFEHAPHTDHCDT